MSSAEAAIAAKRVRDDLAYARFSWFHVQVRGEMEKKGGGGGRGGGEE